MDWAKIAPRFGVAPSRIRAAFRSHRASRGRFAGSKAYWEQRYADGGDSGRGSYGRHAEFKAEVLNDFIAQHGIASVIEFGCGDGNQLTLANYPRYLGFDVSAQALSLCRARFAGDESKSFRAMEDYRGERAELALSLDVIYHLVEDDVFVLYMRTLFGAADRFVIVYSSDTDENSSSEKPHVRHRRFTQWVEKNAPEWGIYRTIQNKHPERREWLTANFFVFQRRPASGTAVG